MIIKLDPVNSELELELIKAGDVLAVNGEIFDFSPMPDGSTLPMSAITSEWFRGYVEKIDGVVIVSIMLPNPWNASPAQRFPEDIVNAPDGPVALPLPLDVTEEQIADREEALLAIEVAQNV